MQLKILCVFSMADLYLMFIFYSLYVYILYSLVTFLNCPHVSLGLKMRHAWQPYSNLGCEGKEISILSKEFSLSLSLSPSLSLSLSIYIYIYICVCVCVCVCVCSIGGTIRESGLKIYLPYIPVRTMLNGYKNN